LPPRPPDEESDEFVTWEVLPFDDENSDRLVIICEDCLTPEEQQAMADDDEATAEAAAELVRKEAATGPEWPTD